MPNVAPSDIFPVVRRFLLESGLNRALKSFDKDTGCSEEDAGASSPKAKALASLELTEACALWLEKRKAEKAGGAAEDAEEVVQKKSKDKKRKAQVEEAEAEAEAGDAEVKEAAEEEQPKKKKKSKQPVIEEESEAEAAPIAEENAEEKAEEEQGKKKKKDKKAAQAEQGEEEAEAADEAQPEANGEEPEGAKKKGKKKDKTEKTPGVPFSRVDHDKWTGAIKDTRLKDNTHLAKAKFGDSAGDSWGDKAAEDMLKVKGKGFRKEMAKKKRASWKGAGSIDQGVNSVPFSDSDDE